MIIFLSEIPLDISGNYAYTAVILRQNNIFTYKPKKSSKRAMGHRQPYSKVKIESIIA